MPTKNMASVGLPGIPDHFSMITVTPNPNAGGSPSLMIDEEQIAGFLAIGNVWNLDVVHSNGNIRKNISRRGTGPSNRHDDDSTQHDFDWLLGMNSLHPSATVTTGHLKPVIRMTNGKLTTIFKTDGIDLLHSSSGGVITEDFGFIGEAAGLEINLRPNEALVLRVAGTDVFPPINYNPTIQYEIKIENVMPHHAHTTGVDHFQAYYALLFPDISAGERRVLRRHDPLERSPNPPPSATINPFKCGGITMNDGEGPLG
jgi:hypothetical protein